MNKNVESKVLIGKTLTEDLKSFRLDALHEFCKENVTVKLFGYMVPWIEEISSKNIGNISDLEDTYAPMSYNHLKVSIVKLIDSCYPQFGTVNDGIPCFAKAEAVVLRVVIIDVFKIYDVLIGFDLLQGELDATAHSQKFLSSIITEAKRDSKY